MPPSTKNKKGKAVGRPFMERRLEKSLVNMSGLLCRLKSMLSSLTRVSLDLLSHPLPGTERETPLKWRFPF